MTKFYRILASLGIPKYMVINKKGKELIEKFLKKKQMLNGDLQEKLMHRNRIQHFTMLLRHFTMLMRRLYDVKWRPPGKINA